MFRIPDGIDPKVRRVLQDIQGLLWKLSRQAQQQSRTNEMAYQFIDSGQSTSEGTSRAEVVEEYQGDWTIHGDLFVDGTIHGFVESSITDIDPTPTDVTSTRAFDTVYQNTESTMIRVDVSAECT